MSHAAFSLLRMAEFWRAAMKWDSDVPLEVVTLVDWELAARAARIIEGSD